MSLSLQKTAEITVALQKAANRHGLLTLRTASGYAKNTPAPLLLLTEKNYSPSIDCAVKTDFFADFFILGNSRIFQNKNISKPILRVALSCQSTKLNEITPAFLPFRIRTFPIPFYAHFYYLYHCRNTKQTEYNFRNKIFTL
jgi:hypothetical protein